MPFCLCTSTESFYSLPEPNYLNHIVIFNTFLQLVLGLLQKLVCSQFFESKCFLYFTFKDSFRVSMAYLFKSLSASYCSFNRSSAPTPNHSFSFFIILSTNHNSFKRTLPFFRDSYILCMPSKSLPSPFITNAFAV